MHSQPMNETDGTFQETEPSDRPCPKCQASADRVRMKAWESSCGGYEDYKFTCMGCGYEWWVEGIDS